VKPSAIGPDVLMHATLVRHPFNRPGWGFEHKLDGFCALAWRERDRIELISRTGRHLGMCFPEIVATLKQIPGTWVLDAELVVPDKRGHPSFELVRRRGVMKLAGSIAVAARSTPAALCVFDLLLRGAVDLRGLHLHRPQEHLAELIVDAPGIQRVKSLEEHGIALFEQACLLDMEGVVGKDLTVDIPRRHTADVGEDQESELLAPGGARISRQAG
jgi:ATP-dependent DNA ligase